MTTGEGAVSSTSSGKKPYFSKETAVWMDVLYQAQISVTAFQSVANSIKNTGSLGVATFEMTKALLFLWFAFKPGVNSTIRFIHLGLAIYSLGSAGYHIYLHMNKMNCTDDHSNTECQVSQAISVMPNAWSLFGFGAAKVIKTNEKKQAATYTATATPPTSYDPASPSRVPFPEGSQTMPQTNPTHQFFQPLPRRVSENRVNDHSRESRVVDIPLSPLQEAETGPQSPRNRSSST